MSALELVGVSKRFGGLQALSKISLAVDPGEVLGLIGPNGAGKSTLVACITGVLRIDGGTIRFQDGDIHRLAHPEQTGYALDDVRAHLWIVQDGGGARGDDVMLPKLPPVFE